MNHYETLNIKNNQKSGNNTTLFRSHFLNYKFLKRNFQEGLTSTEKDTWLGLEDASASIFPMVK